MKIRLAIVLAVSLVVAPQSAPQIPAGRLKFGAFVAQFDAAGTFTLEGQGWPAFTGTWKTEDLEIELASAEPGDCTGPGRYRIQNQGGRLSFALVSDNCTPRRPALRRPATRKFT